jgi:hypothetical protein
MQIAAADTFQREFSKKSAQSRAGSDAGRTLGAVESWPSDRKSVLPFRAQPHVAARGVNMNKWITRMVAVLTLGLSSAIFATSVLADEWPMVEGDLWDVSGIEIKDGGGLAYANFLAGEWRENQEFAKSKGWIKGYMVFANTYPRPDEPDLYLVTITDKIVSGAESEKRSEEYMAWRKKTIAQMQKEGGDRAEFREVTTNFLLEEMKFRK